nr:integrase, catalytic region, zinc finger, CCHC-type, peptidase aspartic, catalytic [Tanacetum cinerariifolium]
MAEITRKKMNAKMNDPECVTRKVKIAPHDYSKQNFLDTFTSQKQLTLEQIFWSNDLIKLKSEALKEQTTVSRPIKALTVYPPNTPATLVLKRITPTGLTEGERGFEQTKECYLKKAIPFFKTLKDNFEGIQKALTKEIKEMKDVFKELEAEVVQIILWYLDSGCSKHMAWDQSRLKNFIKKFIRTVRFRNDHFGAIMGYGDYVIGDSTISRVYYVDRLGYNLFSVRQFCDYNLEVAFRKHSCFVCDTNGVELIKGSHDVFEELEAEVAQYAENRKHDAIERKNLLIANDNLIVECLSKEVFYVATNTDVEVRCMELEAELAKLRNTSHHDNQEELINRFSKLETADSQITKLTEQVTNLQAQNNLFRAENDKIKQHYKELYDSIKITRAKHIEQVTALTTENVNLKAQTLEKVNSVSKDQVKPKVLARGKHAIDVEPIIPCLRNNRDAHLDYLRHLKESVETIRDIVEEARVVRPLDRSIISACRYTKHSQALLEYTIGTCPQGSQQ